MVTCNICGDEIESRQKIKEHRETRHNMFRKIMCRFLPDCVDGNECLFSHDQSSDYNYTQSESNYFCPNGENCTDQSCVFSEARHMKGRVMCRFQENCN